jgi:hypothetical protein
MDKIRIRSGAAAVILTIGSVFAGIYFKGLFWILIVTMALAVAVFLGTFSWSTRVERLPREVRRTKSA